MKITHVKTGVPYQLSSGTQLEAERTNPFFNDYGEQTLPVDLPATDVNRSLLGYPDKLGYHMKMREQIDVSIQDGEYFMPCKQAILSAKRKDSISTSFYMNDGSFYSTLQNTTLKQVFRDETIPGVSTVADGINFCRSLINDDHPYYSISPVLITDDSNNSQGYSYKFINAYGFVANHGTKFGDIFICGKDPTGTHLSDFYNAVSRTDMVEGVTLTMSEGYFISPFIRCNYVLQRIFAYFGYTLLDNFFTKTYPFTKMVFLNNVIDTLVNGTILISQLVPDVLCSDILNWYRKKFHCEFVPDELNKTVSVCLFNDMIQEPACVDLSSCVTSQPHIHYPENYKQIILMPKNTLDNPESSESFDSLADLLAKYPLAYYSNLDGSFYRNGYKLVSIINEKLSECSMRYYLGGNLETEKIEIPECMPEFRKNRYQPSPSIYCNLLYIGKYQTLNSKVLAQTQETVSLKNNSLDIMVAFPYTDRFGQPRCTVTNYDHSETSEYPDEIRLFDYSLCYYGEEGIFEKFYRSYDLLLRNSLHPVNIDLLLTPYQKRSLPAHKKVIISGREMFIDKLKYHIGGSNEPTESELFTTEIYLPIDEAKHLYDILSEPILSYIWETHFEAHEVSKEEYEASEYKDRTPTIIYPPAPSAHYVGIKSFVQKVCLQEVHSNYPGQPESFYEYTYWLECKPF